MRPGPTGARRDRGQALPVYLTVIGALLLLAFAYFAVGQAAATRNGAQTAADAAALAAAQDTRAQLRDALLAAFRSGRLDDLGALLGGQLLVVRDDPCQQADSFAAANKAHTTDCRPVRTDGGLNGYTASVETNYTVGTSVVPGTESRTAHADATAAIEPLCQWQGASPTTSASPPASPAPTPTPPPGPPVGPTPSPSGTPSPGTLLCDGRNWVVDPSNLTLFPSAAELFSVHLTR
ncbi:pilus assembly protein TadG-related protein [Streptomyces silvisoli]|uniref:Pilus assembly protein TadG-related protein n=1 Tax=Streptomyces silvisoli TaxID=3034235 RepID=A0ABT5ZQH3_9ACTN|nr:pilus assembly protein TadG-related protein [Streptomyces silvisoli]MDF3292085.1 pilus assembly protein TadG-related protein [Streptomyces silvisoli]